MSATSTPGIYAGRLQYMLGGQRFSNATLDLVTHREFLYAPETITPPAFLDVDELHHMPTIRVHAAAEAFADKVTALYELHGRDGRTPSTRPHDLVDLLIIARTQTLDADQVRAAISAQEHRRGIRIPCPLTVPNPTWVRDYPDRARHSGLPTELHSIGAAIAAANTVIEPLLTPDSSRRAGTGHWNPTEHRWMAATRRRSVGELLADTRPPTPTSRHTGTPLSPAQTEPPDPRTPEHRRDADYGPQT